MKASPYAKKLAREAGVDVSQASPTGPEGRIVAADVQKLIESGGGKEAPKAEKAAPSKEEAPSAPQRAEVSVNPCLFLSSLEMSEDYILKAPILSSCMHAAISMRTHTAGG